MRSRVHSRAKQRATEQRLMREQRERDLQTDPATMSANELAASIYRLRLYAPRMATEYPPELRARFEALAAEQAKRREAVTEG